MGEINTPPKASAPHTTVEDLLKEHNGDVEAAISAIKTYSNSLHDQVQSVSTSKVGKPFITVRNITKRFKVGSQQIDVLNGVNLEIYPHEIVALTGPSGSGKSTLLQIIGALEKPDDGEVVIDGKNIVLFSDNRLSEFRRETVGFVFQSFYLQPFLNLKDNVMVPSMFSKEKRPDIETRSQNLLKAVGLNDRSLHYPKELSGGQMQRAAIARALMNKPKIILADEPTGNLDAANTATVIKLFKTIRDTFDTSILIVTHDPALAEQADRTIQLRDGLVQ